MHDRLLRLMPLPILAWSVVGLLLALVALAAFDAPRGWVLSCAALSLLGALLLGWIALRREKPAATVAVIPAAAPPPAPSRDPLFEAVPALVWILDAQGRIRDANGRAANYAAADRPAGFLAIIHDVERDAIAAWMSAGREEFHAQARLRRKDGTHLWHHLIGTPLEGNGAGEDGWLVTAVDIEPLKAAEEAQVRRNLTLRTKVAETAERLSEATAAREQTERQLRHTQKMDALSRLAGGIAHDLNNKIIVIGANIDAVVKHLKDAPHLRRKLLAALIASDQASELMSKLLTFARQRDQHPRYVDVAEQLASVCGLLERSFLSDSVAVRLNLPDDLWALEADPHALETAIVNLAVNARDAMAEGGTIAIEAANVTVPRGRFADASVAGDFVRITVSDGGRGIAPEDLERVFEPFFTTKEPGRFTGLGLSQVQGFAEGLGGTVEIASEVGQGTSVSMFLPKAELRARIGPPPVFDDLIEDEEEDRPGAEILIVDDEVEVALALQGMLVELGYEPRIAIGPDEARAEIEASRPALVLTDVTMPGTMDGVALGREIRRKHPSLPVMLITGNPTVVASDSEFPLIQKPITSRALNAALQRHLTPEPAGRVVSLFEARRRAGESGAA